MTQNILTLLNELEKLEKEATPGPVHVGHIDKNHDHAEIDNADFLTIAEVYRPHDQALYCTSRNALPTLLKFCREAAECLRWYGDEKNWAEQQLSNGLTVPGDASDEGEKARSVLEKYGAIE